MSAVQISTYISNYPEELKGAVEWACREAEDCLKAATRQVGQVQVKLAIPSHELPVYRNWETLWQPCVLLEDLSKFPLNVERFKTWPLWGDRYVKVSELARHHIQLHPTIGMARLNVTAREIVISIKAYQDLPEDKQICKQLTYLLFELGNASSWPFYKQLNQKKLPKSEHIDEKEELERQTMARTRDKLKAIGVPDAENGYRFVFPREAHRLYMELVGHVRENSRIYDECRGTSTPLESKWIHPVSSADRTRLMALIENKARVLYGTLKEKSRCQVQLYYLERGLNQNVAANWDWFNRHLIAQTPTSAAG